MNEDEFDDEFTRLVEVGAFSLYGMDENGDPTYAVNMEILERENPDLYRVSMAEIDDTLLSLYNKGFLDLSYDENLDAHFSVTEAGRIAVQGMLESESEE